MKKKKILIISGILTLIISVTVGVAIYFSLNGLKNRDYYVSMLGDNYWKITHNEKYYNFVEHYEKEITKPASEQSKQDFDNLYAKDDPTTGWNNYSSLEHELTSKVLSKKVTLNLNWTNLFKQVNLNDETVNQGQNKLFHFYNVIANLYGKNNILKLVQYAKFDDTVSKYTAAYVDPNRFNIFFPHYEEVNRLYMGLGPIFADQEINAISYSVGFSASADLISSIVHEYGHAVSFFLGSDPDWRGNFNSEPFLTANNQLKKATKIADCTDFLFDYLDKAANISNDSIEKEFFPLIVVRSNYGRAYWLKEIKNWIDKKDEFFAEAFDQWLNTPSNKRTWNWELLNTFFTEKLPEYFS